MSLATKGSARNLLFRISFATAVLTSAAALLLVGVEMHRGRVLRGRHAAFGRALRRHLD